MISKEVRVVADYLVEFYSNPATVAVFASSLKQIKNLISAF